MAAKKGEKRGACVPNRNVAKATEAAGMMK